MSGQVTDAMVERAARAICLQRNGYECSADYFRPYKGDPSPDLSCSCANWNDMQKYARAALESASPQPQGADSAERLINPSTPQEALAAVWASIDGRLPQFGADRKGEADPNAGHYESYLEEAGEAIVRLQKRGFTITPHPQPSGDGLSEETLREMLAQEYSKAGLPIIAAHIRGALVNPELKSFGIEVCLTAMRAVEARVRSQPVQQGSGDGLNLLDEIAFQLFSFQEWGGKPDDAAQEAIRRKRWADSNCSIHEKLPIYFEFAQHIFDTIPPLAHPPTPTDEWRRAVEACAKVCETAGADWHDAGYDHKEYAAAYLAEQIRALSPTKPDDGKQ